MPKVRLQRILARAGVASRRAAEKLIVEGRVRIGSRLVTELGTKADPRREHIFVNGRRVMAEKLVYVLLHKPRGVVCTLSDPEGRTTVADLLRGIEERIVPVGRLDFETSGVLLFTNDGDFAAALAHPRRKAPKVYVAKVNGVVGEEELRRWQESILIDDTWTKPAAVRLLRHENDKAWLEITLREGKNRHIHRLGEHAGFQVMRLARVEYAGLSCEGLRPGMWRYLTVKELTALKGSYGVPKQVRPPPEAVPQKQERTRYKAWKTPQADSRSGRSVGRSRSTGDELHGTAANRGDARRSQGARSSTERGERSRDAGVRFPSESRGRERPSRATPKGSRTGERTPRAVGSRADERPARAIGRGARTDEHRAGATGRRSRAHSGFGDEPGSRRGDYDGRPPRTIEPGRRSASPSDKSVGFGRSSANARTSSRGGFERKSSSIAPARAPKTSRGRWRER